MKKLRVGLVGCGFIGPHHLDAIRRLGFADVTAVATRSVEHAQAKAAELHIESSYGDWRELVAAPDIDVVDITTPTHLHAEIALAAAAAGKHVIVDKPMALTTAEAEAMCAGARAAGVVNAVTFSIRYNVMLQHLRGMVTAGEIGDVNFVQGHYLQEWLLRDTDYNWRIEPDQAGNLAMVADAGAHWYDMLQHVTGRRIVRVLADLSRFIDVRQRPTADGGTEPMPVEIPDLGMVLFELDNGGRAMFSTGAVFAGHKNDLTMEINGSKCSARWQQERPNELWVGHRDEPTQTLLKDPGLLNATAQPYAKLPGGHNEAWTDAFRNLMGNILGFIAEGRDPATADGVDFATFQTGLDVACIIDAITASNAQGGRWVDVPEGESV